MFYKHLKGNGYMNTSLFKAAATATLYINAQPVEVGSEKGLGVPVDKPAP